MRRRPIRVTWDGNRPGPNFLHFESGEACYRGHVSHFNQAGAIWRLIVDAIID